MTIIPGSIIKTFQTKSGKTAVIRYPTLEDADQFLTYINTISKEDTFITFSGEQQTKEQEEKYIQSVIVDMGLGNKMVVACFVDGRLVGVCDIYRDLRGKKRTWHVAIFGLTVARDMRGDGIGYILARTLLEEAKKMEGIRQILLNVYGPNTIAQQLYRKLGFTEAGRIPGNIFYHEQYVDGITMYLNL